MAVLDRVSTVDVAEKAVTYLNLFISRAWPRRPRCSPLDPAPHAAMRRATGR